MSYVLTPLAEQDLIAIWDHIATENIDAAQRVLGRLETAMKKQPRLPESAISAKI